MERTQAELDLEKRLENFQIKSREQLESELMKVFDEVLGDYGRNEFVTYVLPQLAEVYVEKYRWAGTEALLIIDIGSSKPPSQIGDYFRTALQK